MDYQNYNNDELIKEIKSLQIKYDALKQSELNLIEKLNKAQQQQLSFEFINKELKKSETLFHLVFDNSKDSIIWADTATGLILDVNKSTEELFERPASELINQHQSILHPPELSEKYSQLFKDHVKYNGATNIELEIITKTGEIKNVSISSSIVNLGDKSINQGIFKDITEKKIAEQKLIYSEEKFRTIFECSQDAILTSSSLNGQFISGNSAAFKMFNVQDENEFKKHTPAELSPEYQPDGMLSIEKVKVVMGKAIKEGSNYFEWIHKRVNGEEFPATVLLTPMQINGELIIHATIRDITEQKNNEHTIRLQNKKLIELNATKDKFFSIIAHDLRNPFNAIIGVSNLLVNNIDQYDKETIHEFAVGIKNSANQTFKLLGNLLEWSRLQQGTIQPKLEIVNIQSLIYFINLLNIEVAKSKKIELHNNIISDAYAYCDSDMTNTIVRNLISNALKFTYPGGHIYIDSVINDNMIQIIIKDTGIGISAENLPYLFKLEKNISTHGTADEKGTGLGLLLCKELVEKQGGQIWVESEVNKGTSFCFTLLKQ